MGAQHTPGPWAVSKNSSGRRVTNSTGIVICNAVLRNTGTAKSGLKYGTKAVPEAEANARLIAAAPDMLAAIERFMPKGIAIGNGNVPDDLCVPMDVTMGELRAFEAAIAKARGAA